MALRRRSGFTLLELIIVIIVIGILASIALPRYLRVAEKGRAGEAKNTLSALRSAQLRYSAQHGVWARCGNTSNGATNTLDTTTSEKYFSYTATCTPVGANVNDPLSCVASAVRTTVENAGFGAYWINITMEGNLSSSSQGIV